MASRSDLGLSTLERAYWRRDRHFGVRYGNRWRQLYSVQLYYNGKLMALSEDHKAKMKAGRVRAAEARKLAAKSTVAMPAGRERDEQRRINKDANEQRIEERDDALGLEGIDESKLKHRDRETMARLEQLDSEDVQNKQPGYRYARITCPEGYSYNAKANIRQMKALLLWSEG